MPKKLTTEKFIEKAKKIHGDKYDYSLVDYKNSQTKVKIICKKCGKIFEQRPGNHINKRYGCSFCYRNIKKTTKQFIQEARGVHSNKYDYSLVNYKNANIKIKIKCNICGKVFRQTPHNHLMGQGCPKCANKNITVKDFIQKARKVHGDKYDYSLVNYKNSQTKIKIICPVHGLFEQIPNDHLQNSGCPFCKESKGEKKIAKYLIEHNIVFKREYKFFDCKNINYLFFDFYLPELNTCIEYDGEQHFISVKCWGGKKGFKKTQERDKIKTDYCLKNHIRIIRIKYTEPIEDILDLYNLK